MKVAVLTFVVNGRPQVTNKTKEQTIMSVKTMLTPSRNFSQSLEDIDQLLDQEAPTQALRIAVDLCEMNIKLMANCQRLSEQGYEWELTPDQMVELQSSFFQRKRKLEIVVNRREISPHTYGQGY